MERVFQEAVQVREAAAAVPGDRLAEPEASLRPQDGRRRQDVGSAQRRGARRHGARGDGRREGGQVRRRLRQLQRCANRISRFTRVVDGIPYSTWIIFSEKNVNEKRSN